MSPPALPPPLPVPSRRDLLATFATFTTGQRTLGIFQAVAMALLVIPVGARAQELVTMPLAVLVVVAAVAYDMLGGIAEAFFRSALDVGELADDRTLGRYTGAELRTLVDGVRARMGPAAKGVPVFVVAGKNLNAHAWQMGRLLGRRANAVYLNRALLHVLEPAELVYVVGHEFAHLCHYRVRAPVTLVVQLATRVLLALLAFSVLAGAGESAAFMGAVVAAYAHAWLVHRTDWVLSQTVEMLCDDTGARLAGTDAAIRSEIKSGLLSELHDRLLATAVKLRARGLDVSPQQLLAVYERTLPYGEFDADAVERALGAALRGTHEKNRGELSLSGFLEFAGLKGGGERSEDALQEALQASSLLQSLPRVEWPFGLQVRPDDAQVHAMVARLRAQPDHLAFAATSELDAGSTHPSFRRRILYLWENAAEIEGARLA